MPPTILQAHMSFGTAFKTQTERVMHQMKENQLTDPAPNMKSIVSDEQKVLNLRPFDKAKHVSKVAFRVLGNPNSQNERFQDKANRMTSNYMVSRDVGLPALNMKQARMNKGLDSIRQRAQTESNFNVLG